MSEFLLSPQIIFSAAGVAAGSVCVIALGMLLSRIWRRSVPICHGVLLASLVGTALLPAIIITGTACGIGWSLSLEWPASSVANVSGASAVPSTPIESTSSEIYVTADELIARLRGQTPCAATPISEPTRPAPVSATVLQRIRASGTILVAIWLFGAVVVLLRGLRARVRLGQLQNSLTVVTCRHAIAALDQARANLPLKTRPRLICGPHVPTPFCLGLVRPAIALPTGLVESGRHDVLESILIHECAHLARKDLWIRLFQQALGVLYWWNPLLRRADAELADLREELCDTYVLARLADRRGYAAALVEFAAGLAAGPPAAAVGLFSRRKHRLEDRVQRILEEDRPMKATLGFMAKLMLVLFVFLLGAASMLLLVKSPEVFLDEMHAGEGEGMLVSVEPAMAWTDFAAADTAAEGTSVNIAYTGSDNAHEEAAPEATQGTEGVLNETEALDPFFPPSSPEPSLSLVPDSDVAESPSLPVSDDSFAAPVQPTNTFSPPPLFDSEPTPSPAAGSPFDPFAPARPRTINRGLVLVELLGNEDGSLKQLRYLTEDLGNDESAFEQLDTRIQEWKKQFADGVDTEVHLAADSYLRYEHVIRAVQVCNKHVTRIVFAKPAGERQLTVTVGFVRDAAGNKVIDAPVVFWGDQLVLVDKLGDQLNELRKAGDLSAISVLIRADTDVPVAVIEKLIRQGQAAGVENFALRRLTSEAPESNDVNTVIQVDEESQIVQITMNRHAVIEPQMTYSIFRNLRDGSPAQHIGRVEIVRVADGFCEARIIEVEDVRAPIEVGDHVLPEFAPASAEPKDAPKPESIDPPLTLDPSDVNPI